MASARSIVRGKIVEEILETEIRYHHSLTLVGDVRILPSPPFASLLTLRTPFIHVDGDKAFARRRKTEAIE